MLLNIEIPSSIEAIVTGLCGTIKHSRGKNEYVIEYYSSKYLIYYKNGKVLPIADMPKSIYSTIRKKAKELGWLNR